jgi:hypothetical protein
MGVQERCVGYWEFLCLCFPHSFLGLLFCLRENKIESLLNIFEITTHSSSLQTKSILIPLRARTRCWKSRASETSITRDPARDSEAIRFLGSATSARLLNDLPPVTHCTTTSRWTQRHCEHLPASTVNDFIEQLIMTNDENGVAGASGTGPSGRVYLRIPLFIYWFSSLVNR